MNKNLKVQHYDPQRKRNLPVIAVAKIIIKDKPKTTDYYECTIELDENCLNNLNYYVREVVEDCEPLTPKDLGFFIQGILSNIVNFQEELTPKPPAYVAGQRILDRDRKYKK